MLELSLFWAALLAATVLPLSSEAALSAALVGGVSASSALAFATAGNVLGSLSTFYLGRLGKLDLLRKYCRVSPEAIDKTQRKIKRYGAWAAFFCFLPLVGDGIAIALGFMRCPPSRFLPAMALGKLLRYALWIWLHLQIVSGAA